MVGRILLIGILLLSAPSCSYFFPKHDPIKVSVAPGLEKLRAKRDLYILLSALQARPYGFVDGCDGLLFTALGATGGMLADIDVAEDPAWRGKWLRRPWTMGNCYPLESDSEVSGDMILGLITWLYTKKDMKSLEELYDYANAHGNTFGAGQPGATKMSPQLATTILQMIYSLGGRNEPGRLLPMALNRGLGGFEAHIHMLHIWLRFRLFGVDPKGLEVAKHYADGNPHNAFYQAVAHAGDGNQQDAVMLLLDQGRWPETSLPNNHDHHCEPYVFQRDLGEDWFPCRDKPYKVHTGADFIFVSTLILEAGRN